MDADITASHKKHILYKRRWFMLAIIVMFNIANAMMWITFAPVTNYTAAYFSITETQVNWFSLIFFILFVPCCGLIWWFMETAGIRNAAIVGSIVMCIGALLRVVGVLVFTNLKTKFIVAMIGQVLCASTQPLVLSMPTKLAAIWFGDKERTISNTIASMSNPFGVLLANAFAVVLVKKAGDIPMLVIVYSVPPVLTALMTIFGFRSDKPPTPPSAAAEILPESFFHGLLHVIRNKQFMLLCLTTGVGVGLFSTITTILQQLICPQGYSDTIAAVCGAMIIVGGFIGAAISGVYVDKTREYIHIAKIMVLLFGLALAVLLMVTTLRGQTALLIFVFTMVGFFALGAVPVLLEMGVECTYPVDEATSAGMQWMMGQLFGILMMVGCLGMAPDLTPEQQLYSVCSTAMGSDLKPVDLQTPVLVLNSISVLVLLLFVAYFETPYRRLIAERGEQSLINEHNNPVSSIISQ